MVDALGFVKSPSAALAMVDIASAKDSPFQRDAMWFLFNRRGDIWENYGVDDAMAERGLYDPDKVTLTSVVSVEQPKESKLPSIAEILSIEGDAKRGEAAVAVCYTCHKISQQGIDFGPDLTIFGKTQTREVVLNAIINPSADIAHGYEGKRLETKDGIIIDGIVENTGDPTVIKSMGGQTQTVPKKRIKSIKPLPHSLMFSADTLGLTPQTLADIVAYLQHGVK